MKIMGHCRFSFFGVSDTGREVQSQEDAREKLWNPERMAVRFHLFENMMLPSIRAQDDPDFEFVVTTSDIMPDLYQERLDNAVADIAQVRVLRTDRRDIGQTLRPVISEASDDRKNPTIQFRLDDDDAVATMFISRLRSAAKRLEPGTMISFPAGVVGILDQDTCLQMEYFKNNIAIGLALIHAPETVRSPFQIQHRKHSRIVPTFTDPTFPSYHYTRHNTNNTFGYARRVQHTDDSNKMVRRAKMAHAELEHGVATQLAEERIATAFAYTSAAALREVVQRTHGVDRLREEMGF